MKYRFPFFVVLAFAALAVSAKSVTPPADIPTYYAAVNGKSGKNLFDQVHTTAKVGYSSLTYDGLWAAYRYTDLRPDGTVWDMYSDCTFHLGSKECGNYSKECDCQNREHSIPKSWFGGAKTNPGCDIFHLVPTDGYVNNRRGNYPFGEVSSATYTSGNGSKLGSSETISVLGKTIAGSNISATCSDNVFEPIDEYKGDFARGYMGTMIKWAGDYTAFDQGNGSSTFSGDYTAAGYFGLSKYGVALLLKWHRQDPVSQKEIDRNNGIQQTQGNRNPFIDYPYLAEYIWGEKAGETVNLSQLISSSDPRFVPGVSSGYADGSDPGPIPGETYEIVWLVDGVDYEEGNPTIEVAKGGKIAVLPATPVSCNSASETFIGWSETAISGTSDEAPADLFITAENAPAIMSDKTFHAVFAHAETSGGSTTPVSLILAKDQTADWTISGTSYGSSYCILTQGAHIESPAFDLSSLESIVLNLRIYGGTQYDQVDITSGGQNIGNVEVSGGKTPEDYTFTPTATLSGTAPLRFSSTTNTTSNGPAVIKITISAGAATTTYSRYMTSCSGTSAQEVIRTSSSTIQKILRDGQMLIIIDGKTYNAQGTRIR